MNKAMWIKRGALVLGGALLILQFVQPERNTGSAYGPNDITQRVGVPDEVKDILETACFDCHSNHTEYPWYTNIQPVGLWMQDHVDEGKEELNFSEYATYKPKRQKHKMEEIVELVREGEMPLGSYTLMHKTAELTEAQRLVLTRWAESVYNSISVPDTDRR